MNTVSNKNAGVLHKKLKTLLNRNLSELCAIKGNLLGVTKDKEIKAILITSSKPTEGKTVSAISMAYGLTESGAKVLLIDGNLRSPYIHYLFNVDCAPGLTDLITSDAKYYEALRKTEWESLYVMPSGKNIYYSIEVFKHETFKAKLDFLKQMFDYIVFDGHSILISSDVPLVAKYFDGTIIVVECEKTKWEVLQQAKEKINNVGGNVLGVVLNKRSYYIPKIFYR